MAEEMNTTQQPMPTAKIVLGGLAIGLGAILLFALIWIGLGQLAVSTTIRLIAAVCAPPAVMTVITLWLYMSRSKQM